MNRHVGEMCEEDSDPYDCPDYVITYSDVFDEYGLIIHDGGTSSHTISYRVRPGGDRLCGFIGKKRALTAKPQHSPPGPKQHYS
jgi:hypothetical protein